MVAKRKGGNNWDRVVPELSDDGLLLAEASHRVANEVSAAIAAMRLARSGRATASPSGLVDDAIARLEGFATVVRTLQITPSETYDLRRGLEDLCDGLCASREKSGGSMVTLDLVDL